jgi:hypothetical protein
MKVGDFISIFAQSPERPLFAEMLSRNFLFGINKNSHTNFRMQSLSTGMVCTDGFIRGLEVINTIARYCSVSGGVKVITLNGGTKLYNVPYDATTSLPIDVITPDGRFKETTTTDPNTYAITGIVIEELIGK